MEVIKRDLCVPCVVVELSYCLLLFSLEENCHEFL